MQATKCETDLCTEDKSPDKNVAVSILHYFEVRGYTQDQLQVTLI